MATVELSFSALPAHVRTARLVAAAVARRSGVDEALLDEVRLAVGEACSRAVDLHRRHCPGEPVSVRLEDGGPSFAVAVADRAAVQGGTSDDMLEALTQDVDLDGEGLPAGVGLAVITGLVEDVEVDSSPSGAVVTMRWPVTEPAA